MILATWIWVWMELCKIHQSLLFVKYKAHNVRNQSVTHKFILLVVDCCICMVPRKAVSDQDCYDWL
jgi:hypothetical protein